MSIKSDNWIRRMARRARHDRAVRRRAGAAGRRAEDRLLRHLELRLRRALRARVQDLHQHQHHDRRSEAISTRRASSIWRRTSASSRPTPSRSRALSSISAFRAACWWFVWENRPTRAAASSCNVTPLEPEWEGHVTLEFSNTTPLPAKIYANEGVAQMLFFESDEVCATSYSRSRRQVPWGSGRDAAEDLRSRAGGRALVAFD